MCLFALLSLPLLAAGERSGALYQLTVAGKVLDHQDSEARMATFDADRPQQYWSVRSLSGSVRLINPFTQHALRHNGSNIEVGEINGSDENQLWRMEPAAAGTTIFVPATRVDMAITTAKDGSLQLIAKTAAQRNPAAQFKTQLAPVQGFDDVQTYQLRLVDAPGKVVGNNEAFENGARIVVETADATRRGQYWSIKMLDLRRRMVGNAFFPQHFDDGGQNASIDGLIQWSHNPNKPGNAQMQILSVPGQTDTYVVASHQKTGTMFAHRDGRMVRVPLDLKDRSAWSKSLKSKSPKSKPIAGKTRPFLPSTKSPATPPTRPMPTSAKCSPTRTSTPRHGLCP